VQNLVHVVFSTKENETPGLYNRRLQQRKDPAARNRRNGRPRPFVDPTAAAVIIVGRRFRKLRPVHLDGWERALHGSAALPHSVAARRTRLAVVRYIRTQDTHHMKMDFKSELIALLEKHGVPYDPKYVFD